MRVEYRREQKTQNAVRENAVECGYKSVKCLTLDTLGLLRLDRRSIGQLLWTVRFLD